jgi:hypothetical protein
MTLQEADEKVARFIHLREVSVQPTTEEIRKRHLGQINQTESNDPSRERVWVRRVILKRQEP